MHSQAVCSGESWRHNSINKSDPYGAADVFLISLCSTIESSNWLSLQHLPNSLVCVFAAVLKKKKVSRQSGRLRIDFSLWGACICRIVPLLKPKVYLSSRMWRSFVLRLWRFLKGFFAKPGGSCMKEFPKQPSWDPQQVLKVLWRTAFTF